MSKSKLKEAYGFEYVAPSRFDLSVARNDTYLVRNASKRE